MEVSVIGRIDHDVVGEHDQGERDERRSAGEKQETGFSGCGFCLEQGVKHGEDQTEGIHGGSQNPLIVQGEEPVVVGIGKAAGKFFDEGFP